MKLSIAKRRIFLKEFAVDYVDLFQSQTAFGTKFCIENNSYGIEDIALKPTDTCLDIGANIGLVGLYLSLKCPGIKIISFEPSIINYNCLLNNYRFNRVYGYHYPYAITAKTGEILTLWSHTHNSGATTLYDLDYESENKFELQAKTISFLDILNNPLVGSRIKFLKMDIEGAEYDIFESLILNKIEIFPKIEYLAIELHDQNAYKKEWKIKRKDVVDYLDAQFPKRNLFIEIA